MSKKIEKSWRKRFNRIMPENWSNKGVSRLKIIDFICQERQKVMKEQRDIDMRMIMLAQKVVLKEKEHEHCSCFPEYPCCFCGKQKRSNKIKTNK